MFVAARATSGFLATACLMTASNSIVGNRAGVPA